MGYDREGASRYDEIHAARFADAETTADLLADLYAKATASDGRAGPVLELGVGTGRVALPLAARGLEVHGIDSSPEMIAALRAKPSGDAITVHEGDFARAGARIEGEFPLVYVVFNTLFELLTQDDQIGCIAGVAEHLSPHGVLVIEALAPEATRLEQTLSVLALDDESVTLRATAHDPLSQQVSAQDITIRAGTVQLRPWSIRYATVPEVDLMARLAGLRLVERWGGWRREPFTAASPRHVSVYGK